MKKVLILGASGMLGNAVIDVFSKDPDIKLTATARNNDFFDRNKANVDWQIFDAESSSVFADLEKIVKNGFDYLINCIGIIKPFAQDGNFAHINRAIRVNALFPQIISELSLKLNFKVLQIATDCVFSGFKGNYNENDKHDALDVYGKTKSLGEVFGNPNFYNLRCSIIGKEKKSFVSLLEWFLKQPKNAELNGFNNHNWNGVTTHHFGKICLGIIKNNISLTQLQHIVAGNILNKYEILQVFAKSFNRNDLIINSISAPQAIDRTITTIHKELNSQIWLAAGYNSPPTIERMIEEIAKL